MPEKSAPDYITPVDWKICPTPAPGESSGTSWGVARLPDEPAHDGGEMKPVMIDKLGQE